jgi:hypothetical protein
MYDHLVGEGARIANLAQILRHVVLVRERALAARLRDAERTAEEIVGIL